MWTRFLGLSLVQRATGKYVYFRRGIHSPDNSWFDGRDRGEINYNSTFLFHHLWHEEMRHVDHGLDVDLDHLVHPLCVCVCVFVCEWCVVCVCVCVLVKYELNLHQWKH